MLNTDNKTCKILALTIAAFILGVESQISTCTSTSPECCWVVRSWQLMGKSTGISSTDNSCCTPPTPMSGVTCDSTNKVIQISWPSEGLSGSIPRSMGKLTSLTWLDLNKNQLSGSIPASIGNLINLGSLILYNNQLSGSIPVEIGNLTNLGWLYLFGNQLSGTIPPVIGNLIDLQRLQLSYNPSLSGTFTARSGMEVSLSGTSVTLLRF